LVPFAKVEGFDVDREGCWWPYLVRLKELLDERFVVRAEELLAEGGRLAGLYEVRDCPRPPHGVWRTLAASRIVEPVNDPLSAKTTGDHGERGGLDRLAGGRRAMDSSVARLALQLLCFSAVFFLTTALLSGRTAVVRMTSVLLGVLFGALGLEYTFLLPAAPGPSLLLLRVTAGIGAVLLLALALLPTAWPRGRRESEPRRLASAAFLAWAIVGVAASWLGLSHLGQAGPVGLPFLEALALGFLLGSRRRRGLLAVVAAVPPLFLLGTARFGLLGGGALLQGLCLAGFALGLPALRPGARVRPENEGPEEVTDVRGELEWSQVPGWLAWCAVGLSLTAELLLVGWPGHPALDETTSRALWQTAASSLVLALAAGGLAARFPAWASPPFRYLAWRGAHALGAWRAWLRVGSHGWLLGAAVGGSAIGMIGALSEGYLEAMRRLITEDKVLLGALAILVILLETAYQTRRRIFVADFTGEKLGGEEIPGAALATCLRHELATITLVHRTIDEALPASDGRMPKLEVTVEDVGASLEATIGPLPLSNWTNVVPFLLRATGLLRGPHLSGRFHRESSNLMLTVELSGGGKKGSWRVSADELATEEARRHENPTEGPNDLALAYRMVRQMAYRVAATQASLGSPRWEAVRSFTDGLRAYRKVRLTEFDRDFELRVAERCFREALQYDKTFNQGHYNLGVVYSRLREYDAALAAFRQAIAAEPSSFSAHLAVAMAYFDRAEDLFYREAFSDAVEEDFLQARVFAGRAIALAPSEPRPWNVYGAATLCWAWKGMAPPDGPAGAWRQEEQQAIEALRVASALAWRRLCRCELSGSRPVIDEAKFVTGICLENLAEAYFEGSRVEESLSVLREALRLAPRKPSLHLALGKALASSKAEPSKAEVETLQARLIEAENELYDVHGDGLSLHERAGRWAWLLAVHWELMGLARSSPASASRRRQRAGVDRALRGALGSAAPPEELVMTAPREGEGPDPRASTSRYRKQLELLRLELRRSGLRPSLFARDKTGAVAIWTLLEKRLDVLEQTERGAETSEQPAGHGTARPERDGQCTPWATAQSGVHRARKLLTSDPTQAALLLERALATLRRRHHRQVRDQGLETLLARAYLELSEHLEAADGTLAGEHGGLPAHRPACLHRALDYAFRGVAAKPEGALRREVLAEIFEALEDHDQAEAERRAALSLGSPLELLEDPKQLRALYETWRRRIRAAQKPGMLIHEAIDFFEHLRKLLESSAVPAPEPKRGGPRKLPFKAHAAIHQYLGILQGLDPAKHDDAKANLAVAQANDYHRPVGADVMRLR
jgi:tetratricopeptide (TPR) repeat protein